MGRSPRIVLAALLAVALAACHRQARPAYEYEPATTKVWTDHPVPPPTPGARALPPATAADFPPPAAAPPPAPAAAPAPAPAAAPAVTPTTLPPRRPVWLRGERQ